MNRPEAYFLLIYDVPARSVEVEPFEGNVEAALDRYAVLEAEHRDEEAVEVVLVGADSLETVKRTHGHYFDQGAIDQFDSLLEDVMQNVQAAVKRAQIESDSVDDLDKQAT